MDIEYSKLVWNDRSLTSVRLPNGLIESDMIFSEIADVAYEYYVKDWYIIDDRGEITVEYTAIFHFSSEIYNESKSLQSAIVSIDIKLIDFDEKQSIYSENEVKEFLYDFYDSNFTKDTFFII